MNIADEIMSGYQSPSSLTTDTNLVIMENTSISFWRNKNTSLIII